MSLGLAELVARSRPDECPFCGEKRLLKSMEHDAVLKRYSIGSKTDYQLTCGDEVCRQAYHTYYARDRVRPKLTRAQKDENNRKKREKYALAKKRFH